ncbi:hypothetical protein BO71DRAFT_380619, partial [Aspergillus ellipticus CBS 707.79]
MARSRRIRKRPLNSPRSRQQQRARRKENLFLKSFEYCQECDTDIFIMLLSAEESASHYPKPNEITW